MRRANEAERRRAQARLATAWLHDFNERTGHYVVRLHNRSDEPIHDCTVGFVSGKQSRLHRLVAPHEILDEELDDIGVPLVPENRRLLAKGSL